MEGATSGDPHFDSLVEECNNEDGTATLSSQIQDLDSSLNDTMEEVDNDAANGARAAKEIVEYELPDITGMTFIERFNGSKSCVSLAPQGGKAKSPAWKWFYRCTPMSEQSKIEMGIYEPAALQQFDMYNNIDMFCCRIYYNVPWVSLESSLRHVKNNSPSNLSPRIKTNHAVSTKTMKLIPGKINSVRAINPEDEPENIWAKENPNEFINDDNVLPGLTPRKRKADTTDSTITSKSNPPVPEISVEEPLMSLPPNSQCFSNMKLKGDQQVIDKWHALTVNFANEANVAQRQFTDPKCKAFKELMDFTLSNAKQIMTTKKGNRYMGKERFTRKRFDNFEAFISAVIGSVNESRTAYHEMAGGPISWMNVCHDGWKHKKHEKHGVSICFHNPVCQSTYCIAIGLCHAPNGKSKTLAEVTVAILLRFGIIADLDAARGANDNANNAAKATELITKMFGRCVMHLLELMMEHALGIKKRNMDGNVVDQNPSAELVCAYVKSFVGVMMDGRSKRYTEYVKMMTSLGRKCIQFTVPNSTRVAGCHIMYQNMIKSRWNLYAFHKRDKEPDWAEKVELSNNQWLEVAQMEGIISYGAGLAIAVQSDTWDLWPTALSDALRCTSSTTPRMCGMLPTFVNTAIQGIVGMLTATSPNALSHPSYPFTSQIPPIWRRCSSLR